jgi:DNA cross-link repair 1A protein
MPSRSSSKPLTPRTNSKFNVSVSNHSNTIIKKAGPTKTPGKPNNSILNFFKKVDGPLKEESIFLSQGAQDGPILPSPDLIDEELESLYSDDRFNEFGGSVKRRKKDEHEELESGNVESMDAPAAVCTPSLMEKAAKPIRKKLRKTGPFLSDSDTEDEGDGVVLQSAERAGKEGLEQDVKQEDIQSRNDLPEDSSGSEEPDARQGRNAFALVNSTVDPIRADDAPIPPLKKEDTSMEQWGEFDDPENFFDDEYAEGEEFTERRWMEEQALLEAADGQNVSGFLPDKEAQEEITAACPICDTNLSGLAADEATRHVNGCLDGDRPPTAEPPPKLMTAETRDHFARKAAIPRPGQANPFQIGGLAGKPSAFSAIMSGNAEDAAWATAAAAEQASRGRPAYQRTCPFYKIMPGFSICVDAFRYGAVQGCNAYFLSHFHSDHYVGLTASWSHGPIYCSKVTANLVTQQLQVNSKWVVALDFEDRFEVPDTQSVAVTMIPANHCPGSSLFLFDKAIGKGANPKVYRVLHCGDFRACPAHLAHPLLMPNVVDAITGRTRQQKIDVCYLDTTYLNPRYAFPPQEDVIRACAEMCVRLADERANSDAGEAVRGTSTLENFVKSAAPKAEEPGKLPGRLLVVCGTYSIGKEKICMGIARALDCKIWAPAGKRRICAALEDEELMSRMTDDPREAQIHMQMLMEIRPETLLEYLEGFQGHFSRVVGFRPSGWNYRPPNSRLVLILLLLTLIFPSNLCPAPYLPHTPSLLPSLPFQAFSLTLSPAPSYPLPPLTSHRAFFLSPC